MVSSSFLALRSSHRGSITMPYHLQLQRSRPQRCGMRLAAQAAETQQDYVWNVSDEFDSEDDRHDEPPLPLPSIDCVKTLTLVRHGQSQWNALGRIQGSSNLSLLTEKGYMQAEAARKRVEGEEFDAFFSSPLQRSSKTGEIIWGGRPGAAQVVPSLREVDLYSFQGLRKADGKALYGERYLAWQSDPAAFEIDGHAPVRELWYRGSLALQTILMRDPPAERNLVVAHNAVNQALIGVSLGLPPSAFRRLVQTNAATTLLRYAPQGSTPAAATLLHLNQSPDVLAALSEGAVPAGSVRVLLVTYGSLPGQICSAANAQRTADVLKSFQVDKVICDDSAAAREQAEAVSDTATEKYLPSHLWQPLQIADCDLERSPSEREALGIALHDHCTPSEPASSSAAGAVIVAVISCERAAALVHNFCGLGQERAFAVELQPASISCADVVTSTLGFGKSTVHCVNSRAHLTQLAIQGAAVGAEQDASDV